MDFDDARIILDNEAATYNPGENISGKIVFDLEQRELIQGIYVSCKGFCKVCWKQFRTKYHGYEEYFNKEYYIFGDGTDRHVLERGNHEYKFDCLIPSNCPSSFEGKYGHVRYEIKALIVISKTQSTEKKCLLRINVPVDLNLFPCSTEPINVVLKYLFTEWCCINSGYLKIQIYTPRKGYLPGETIRIRFTINNFSSIIIDGVAVALRQLVKYTSTNPEACKEKYRVVTEHMHCLFCIKPEETRDAELLIDIPQAEICNMTDCRLIDISYNLMVITSPSGIRMPKAEEYPIILGSIPLI